MAPIPAKERMRQYRQRMNNEKKEELKQKDRERHKSKRSMRTKKQLDEDRKKSKLAMQLIRKKRSEESIDHFHVQFQKQKMHCQKSQEKNVL